MLGGNFVFATYILIINKGLVAGSYFLPFSLNSMTLGVSRVWRGNRDGNNSDIIIGDLK